MRTSVYVSDIWDSHSTDLEDGCVLVCDILSSGRKVPT
jgi:hypothetical protein